MTEKITRVSLAELTIVRVTCQACNLTTEMEIAKIDKAMTGSGACKHCNATLLEISDSNPLRQLMLAARKINESTTMSVEFVIKEPTPP
jgi:hypothetical protein